MGVGVGPGANMNVGAWGASGNFIEANKLEVSRSSMTVTQPAISFAGTPFTFEKLGAGKLIFSDANGAAGLMQTLVTGRYA